MSRWAQGKFQPTNPSKYIGRGIPTYRSGWEWAFMRFCDTNDNVLQWASECMTIPYRNPFTGRQTVYVPDFLITYRNRNNTVCAELIEIKPKKQSMIEGRMNTRDRAVVALNHAKWAAATLWCKRNGLKFRVVTEDSLFHRGK